MYSLFYYSSSLVFLCYILLQLSWKFWKRKLSFLPSHSNVPWLGSLPYLNTNAREIYKQRIDWSAKYNYLYVIWLGSEPILRAGRVEYVEPIFCSKYLSSKPQGYKVFHDWLGTGLVTADGNQWKKRRAQLTGAFHFPILNNFMEIYERHADNLVNHLKQHLHKGQNVVEVQELMGRAMLDVICETSMGVTVNALESATSKYVQAAKRMKDLTEHRFFPSIRNNRFIYPFTDRGIEYKECLSIINTFIRDVITQNLRARKNNYVDKLESTSTAEVKEDERSTYTKKKKRVFIDILLDLYEEGNIDTKGIEDEVNTFMFAGHDTTSTAISWILYDIGRHPEIQSKLHKEVDEISAQTLSLVDKIRSLKYMECVIKEGLRIHPPISAFSRRLDENMVVDGNVVPAGTVIQIDVISIHRNPQYWPNPSVFDPTRFQSDNATKRNPYCFIPFSAGARNCIGQKFAMLNLKVYLFALLSNFSVVSMQDPEDLQPGTQITVSSMNGINIKFNRR